MEMITNIGVLAEMLQSRRNFHFLLVIMVPATNKYLDESVALHWTTK